MIGGTACDLLMENEDMTFRATKDIDIVLIVEAITAEFGKAFWEYIKEAEYEHKNKSTGNTQFYRFTSPKSKEYPFMIEIFSKKPEFIELDEMEKETVDLKALGIRGFSQKSIMSLLRNCYGME